MTRRRSGGQRDRRRPARRLSDSSWQAPAWLIPAVFLCLLVALAVIIVVMAAAGR